MEKIHFIKGVPFSEVNVELYRHLYVIEQWLRRITYATLLLCHGDNWLGQIPGDILSALKQRGSSLRGRIILDCENDSNLIWSSTLDELNRLLTMDSHWSMVNELTAYPKRDFTEWINVLRQIRNIVGHNRGTTFQTLNIFTGIQRYLNQGIVRFATSVFHHGYNECTKTLEDDSATWRITNSTFPHDLICLFGESKLFCDVAVLPRERNYHFLDISMILEKTRPIHDQMLAIAVNLDGDEYGIIQTNNMVRTSDINLDAFFTNLVADVESSMWIRNDYTSQSAKYICDPKVWFYSDKELTVLTDGDGTQYNAALTTSERNNVLQFPEI